MKKLPTIYLVLVIVGLSCIQCNDKVEFATGLDAKVYFGQGDCMPAVYPDIAVRKYDCYSGMIYIVRKREYDSLNNKYANCNCISTKIDSLKNNSIRFSIKGGRLTQELQPDSFIILIDPKSSYCSDNVIYVKTDSIVKRNLYFFNCTSY